MSTVATGPGQELRTPPGLHLTESDFRLLSEFIYQKAGIHLAHAKKIMVETRLRKRVEELRMASFHVYCQYVTSPKGEAELVPMLDRITTNKTDFFREPVHFEFLMRESLPAVAQLHQSGLRQPLAIWSAGCSSGEEPYTMAMVLNEYAAAQPGGRYRFAITATDLSTRVLEKAQAAIYAEELVAPVPLALRRKYLLRSKDRTKPAVRIVPELRAMVQFRRLNFMDSHFGFDSPFDVIFCRNVMIYFDKPTQEKLVYRFASNLRPGGYLFIGHSETLNGLSTRLTQVAPSVYRNPV